MNSSNNISQSMINRFRIFMIIFGVGLLLTQYENCSNVSFSEKHMQSPDVGGVGGVGERFAKQSFSYESPPSGKVDILIVDDNSGSMKDHQRKLSEKFPNFIANLKAKGLDWQLAITTTDVCSENPDDKLCTSDNIVLKDAASGRFLNQLGQQPTYGEYILNPNTAQVDKVFANTIQRTNANIKYEQGSGDERAIYAVNLVVDARTTFAKNFFRDNSNFAVIIISDEDERSVGGNDPEDDQNRALEEYDKPQTLINHVIQAFGGKKSLLVNSIVATGIDIATGEACKTHEGFLYKQLSAMTRGYVGSICDKDYDAVLTGIAGALQSQNMGLVLNLQHLPTATPAVNFIPNNNKVEYSWKAGSQQLTLATRPAAGTVVEVLYSY